jgi:predicted nuclease with TOPRIM domain
MIHEGLIPFTQSRVAAVEDLDAEAASHLESLQGAYYARLEEYQTQRTTGGDVMSAEKSALTDAVRRLEMAGAKLEYELDALVGRIAEVEDGVQEFERSVEGVEARVGELVGEEALRSAWWVRVVEFLGSGK